MTEPDPIPSVRRPGRTSRRPSRRVVLVLITATAAAGLAGVYVARRTIAREALLGWLRSQGVEAQIQVGAFDLGGVSAGLVIGRPDDPDLTAERMEVRYGLRGPWSGERLGVRVASVRMVRPMLRGYWRQGKLSLGSLDPMVARFLARPPEPDADKPRIEIEDGRLRIDSDYGRVQARGGARIVEGRLVSLEARSDPTSLKGRWGAVALYGGELRLITKGDQVNLNVETLARTVRGSGFAADETLIRLAAILPYPDLAKRAVSGPMTLQLVAQGGKIVVLERELRDGRIDLRFDGAGRARTGDMALSGRAEGDIRAAQAKSPIGQARDIHIELHAHDLNWSRAGSDQLRSDLAVLFTAGGLDVRQTRLSAIRADLGGSVALDAKGPSLDMHGMVAARGSRSGPLLEGDTSPEAVALRAAVADFAIEAPAISVKTAASGLTVALPSPVRLKAASGGLAILSAVDGRPVIAPQGGGLRLTLGGGGLPQGDLRLDRLRIAGGDVSALARLQAKASLGPVRHGAVDAIGDVRISESGATFVANRCVALSAERLDLGDTVIEDAGGELCPGGGPMVRFAGRGWRLEGDYRQARARAPGLESQVSEASGAVVVSADAGGLEAQLGLSQARLTDLAPEPRFRPVVARGQALLTGGQWTGDFAAADPAGRTLASARLRHDVEAGRGRMDFDTDRLVFESGGLQPSALSPLAAVVGSPADGAARFKGYVAWGRGASRSGGTLDIEHLNFRSPAGPVQGLSGQIVFTSLSPLVAAPGQELTAERVQSFADLIGTHLTFAIADDALAVSGAEFALGGGTVRLEPFQYPLKSRAAWNSVIVVDKVQLKDLVEASPFGDRVDLIAKVSGRIPFSVSDGVLRVAHGEVHAVEPGALSIRREALTGVDAGATTAVAKGAKATAPVPPDIYQDFVYQALEHLAFDTLEASVDSQPAGRLGVLFHIQGKHNPPSSPPIRLTLREIITRKIKRALPLPAGTKVNLTLDTSTNLDQLLHDFADYQRLRSSQAVQPAPAKIKP